MRNFSNVQGLGEGDRGNALHCCNMHLGHVPCNPSLGQCEAFYPCICTESFCKCVHTSCCCCYCVLWLLSQVRIMYCEMLGHDVGFAYIPVLQMASDPNLLNKKVRSTVPTAGSLACIHLRARCTNCQQSPLMLAGITGAVR